MSELRWTGDFGTDLPGASELAGAEGQLDLLNVTYATSDQVQDLIGGSIRPGNVTYSDVFVYKLYSPATAKLGAVRNQQKEIAQIVLTQWTRDAKNEPSPAIKYTLDNCKIVNLQPGTPGESTSFQIFYRKITIDTWQEDDKGMLKPAGTYGYDRIKQQAF